MLVVSRKERVAEGVGMVLAGRFDVVHARSARAAERALSGRRPLVVTLGLKDLDAVGAMREATGRGCLFIATGKLPYGHKLRGAPKDQLLSKLDVDDFVGRELGGEDLGKLIWSHVAAAIRAVPKPKGEPRRSEAETWGEILTSDASIESFRKVLTKDVVQVHELSEDSDPTWSELLRSRVSGTAIKKLFTKKL